MATHIAYATPEDVRDYAPTVLAETDPDTLRRVTGVACHAVRRHTSLARYDADDDGLPSRPDLREAMREATCAQAVTVVAHGLVDDVLTGGVTAEPTLESTSSNGKSLRFKNDSATSARAQIVSGGLVPEARMILDAAGLLGGVPGVIR